MAAITTISTSQQRVQTIRNAAAQATTGQTDWVAVPVWARYMKVYVNYTATAGNTPTLDFKIVEYEPVLKDDATVSDLGQWNGITQVAGATVPQLLVIQVGPGITGIADDDTANHYSVNALLPPVVGLKTTLDRTQGDETYTYTIAVVFSK